MRNRIRLLLLLAGTASLLLAASTLLSPDHPIPTFAETQARYQPSEAWLLDRNGEVIAVKRIDAKVRRLEWTDLNNISPATQKLLLMSEDKRFYLHSGVDWLALISSSGANLWHLLDGKRPRGASTLTMQLAGFLDPTLAPAYSKRTIAQKLKQIAAAREIEKNWSKPEILEAYFNLAAFRGEIVGINAASSALFGVQPSALDRSQSLLLVALLKGPMAKPEQVANRACALLKHTKTANSLPPQAGEGPGMRGVEHVQQVTSAQQPLSSPCAELQALALQALDPNNQHIPQDSLAPHLAQKLLEQPGARVATTLDANLQRAAIQSMREHLLSLNGQNVKDAAAIVIDNKTGDVLAYVGSSGELSDATNVDGVSALRQAGSTLKPFLYGKAIEERLLTAASVLDDSPIQLITPMGLYIPQNYDRDFKGTISVRTALASSLNVPAVRTLGLVGVDRFTRTLRTYGLTSLAGDGDHYGFSLALGGVDIRLLELANAYRALANKGEWRPLRFTTAERAKGRKQVLSRQASFIVADILADKGARALTFGLENPLATRVWTAAKTGTSKDMRDNWCIGFSGRYTVGVWVGNFNGEPMRDVSGVSGAAPIWRDLMDYLHRGNSSTSPKAPRGIVTQQVRFSPAIESPRTESFLVGTETGEIRLVATNNTEQQVHAKILYPTNGTIIAMDPDIPVNHQRVQLSAKGSEQIAWAMDGNDIGSGTDIGWTPTGGRHRLVLSDPQGNELDAVSFDVRGAWAP
ncbi:MAG: transglycosylase domain-containing protein [Sideroxyarcus sp.]